MSSVNQPVTAFAATSMQSPAHMAIQSPQSLSPQSLNPQSLNPQSLNPITLRWVMKRVALGVIILVVAFGSIAWLTYASIEQGEAAIDDAETANAQ